MINAIAPHLPLQQILSYNISMKNSFKPLFHFTTDVNMTISNRKYGSYPLIYILLTISKSKKFILRMMLMTIIQYDFPVFLADQKLSTIVVLLISLKGDMRNSAN